MYVSYACDASAINDLKLCYQAGKLPDEGNTSNEATQYSSNWQSPDLETKNPRQIIDQAYSFVTTMLQHDFGEVPELSLYSDETFDQWQLSVSVVFLTRFFA